MTLGKTKQNKTNVSLYCVFIAFFCNGITGGGLEAFHWEIFADLLGKWRRKKKIVKRKWKIRNGRVKKALKFVWGQLKWKFLPGKNICHGGKKVTLLLLKHFVSKTNGILFLKK